MKRISKNPSPSEFERWKQAEGDEVSYRTHSTDVRRLCLQSLIKEQGGLCCYTGVRIDESKAHIEHLFAQCRSHEANTHEDLDYKNMLAAFPRTGNCTYGAMKKGNKEITVTPLCSDCESRFTFDLEGTIKCRRIGDEDAERTIEVLNLNDRALVSRRKAAIDALLSPETLSKTKVAEVKERMRLRNGKGQLPVFCFVLEQVCDLALQIQERRAQKRQYAARSQRSTRN